jgi:hypothetical protein
MINNISECQETPPKLKQNYISNSSVVRKIFQNVDNDSPGKKIKIISDILTSEKGYTDHAMQERQNIHNPFKNTIIKIGICFTCVKNINMSPNGVKCTTCRRTYHIPCILKFTKDTITSNDYFKWFSCLKLK